MSFKGFPADTQKFLKQLKENNNRQWFSENKARYEALVMEPALDFIAAMEEPLKKVSPFFTAIPKRSGGSMMRVYRDIRFSKDKTPYKPFVGIHFRHEAGKDAHAPGFYFHIGTDEVFLGAGIWHPEPAVLEQIRFAIDDQPERWKKIVRNKLLTRVFEFDGERLKRPPKNYDAHHPLIEDLKWKDHFVLAYLPEAAITSAELVPQVASHFKITAPYMRFLCDAVRLPC
jgi:uncharacterized protein (TIGR02453 family)